MSDEWRTPPELFRELNKAFNFFWDACSNKDNCLVEWQKHYYTYYGDFVPNMNYLEEKLNTSAFVRSPYCDVSIEQGVNPLNEDVSVFINPPYSRGSVLPIIKKAWEDAKYFKIVLLLKCDMSTDWFNWILDNNDVFTIDIHQRTRETITDAIRRLNHRSAHVDYNHIGLIYLRKRVKFLDENGNKVKSTGTFPSMIMVLDRRVRNENT